MKKKEPHFKFFKGIEPRIFDSLFLYHSHATSELEYFIRSLEKPHTLLAVREQKRSRTRNHFIKDSNQRLL